MAPEPGLYATAAQAKERGAALALFPAATTLAFYAIPASLQEQTVIQFVPQIVAYIALGLWAMRNRPFVSLLGLGKGNLSNGLRWGLLTGLLLSCLNTLVILTVYPHLGYDISFLKTTPHGRLPLLIMVPWFITSIAFFVELNFRGFLLGRLAALESGVGVRLSPTFLAARPHHLRTDICFRPLYGEYFPAPALDRTVGRSHLGNHLATYGQSLHHDRCACSRSDGDVSGGESGD
jgi:hypothetical protein